ncbi:pre-rRNA-processing protein ESF2 [Cryptococcus depauperatus]
MTPQKRKDGPGGYNPDVVKQKRQKYISANFSEAWVKFLDKSIAKTAASMLNAQVIEERRETDGETVFGQ